ncbi:MAG: amidohydrolase family protein, partial [Flavitalea sp.]
NAQTQNKVISIHNQEHPAEDQLYIRGDGDYLKLFSIFGFKESPFPVTGKSSLRSYLPHFDNGQTILLVHNSFTTEEDILFANKYAERKGLTLMYCLCINANRYIEDKIPPVDLLIKHNCKMVLGTDSYSSNWELSIAKEIESILSTHFFRKQSFKNSVETVLTWATINGARALQMESVFGSFEKGKRPGVVLIENMFENDSHGSNLVSKRIF